MGKRVHHLREVSEEEESELRTQNTCEFTHARLSDGAACEVDCEYA